MLIDCNHGVPEFGSVVRLSQFSPREVERLQSAVQSLTTGETDRFDLSPLGIIDPSGIHWSFVDGRTDAGLIVNETASIWRLTPASWDNVAGLLEPFMNHVLPPQSHQWLSHCSDASLLITVNGRW